MTLVSRQQFRADLEANLQKLRRYEMDDGGGQPAISTDGTCPLCRVDDVGRIR